MKCPNCTDQELLPKELETGLIIANCRSCHGNLFPLMNYRFWLQANTETKPVEVEDIQSIDDSTNAKLCPGCSRFLAKFSVGSGTGNKLELCDHCDQAWLDKGEWELLKSLNLQYSLAKIFTDAWQYQVRRDQQQTSQDQRLEKLVGQESFETVKNFKLWLDQQPEKSAILQYLHLKY